MKKPQSVPAKKYGMTEKCEKSLELLREIESWDKTGKLKSPFSLGKALAELKKKILEDMR